MDLAWFGCLLVIFYQNVFQLKSFDTLYSKFNRKMVDNFAEKHLGRKSSVNFQIMQDPRLRILDNVHVQLHTDF